MMRIEQLSRVRRKKYEIYIVCGLGILLACFYLYNVKNICTLWQMDDEGMYIFNASLLSGYDWKETFTNVTAYFGYGYSLLLIPLFSICPTGIALIRGSIVINVLCVIGIYFLQTYLMSKLCDKCMSIVAIVSFVTCFTPFLVSNAMMVVCESFLYFWYLVIAVVLYKTMKARKTVYCICLGITVAFIFFIHTRAIVIVGVVGVGGVILALNKKTIRKRVIIFLISFLLFFTLFYFAKNFFVNILGSGKIASQNKVETGNLLSGSVIIDRIRWLFSKGNLKRYALCAAGKFFYILASTAGTFLFGIFYVVKSTRNSFAGNEKNINEVDGVKLFLIFSFVAMYLVCCVWGTGTTYAYMIYGRYYEYCVMPIVIMGVFYLIESTNIRIKYIVVIIIISMGSLSKNLAIYAESDKINIDARRIPGISYAVACNETYNMAIYFLIAVTVCWCTMYILVQNHKLKKVIIPMVLFLAFFMNSKEAIKAVNEVNKNCSSDIDIADYIEQNMENQQICFIYEPYRYDSFYRRMQIFIKNYPMHIIFPDEIDSMEEGTFLITYINSEMSQKFKESDMFEHCLSSTHYELFIK